MISLVCKSWSRLVCEPSSLWASTTVDLNSQKAPLRAPAQDFFRKRKRELRSLHLLLPAAQAAFASDILEALGNEPPLKRMSIDFGGADVSTIPTFLPQIAWLRQLKALRITGLQVKFKGFHTGLVLKLEEL